MLDTFDSILANVTEGHDTQKGFFMCPKLSDTTVSYLYLETLTLKITDYVFERYINQTH